MQSIRRASGTGAGEKIVVKIFKTQNYFQKEIGQIAKFKELEVENLVSPSPEEVKSARKARGLSQQQAANIIFVSPSTWGRWERGNNLMPPKLFRLFIAATEIFDLFGNRYVFCLEKISSKGRNPLPWFPRNQKELDAALVALPKDFKFRCTAPKINNV